MSLKLSKFESTKVPIALPTLPCVLAYRVEIGGHCYTYVSCKTMRTEISCIE